MEFDRRPFLTRTQYECVPDGISAQFTNVSPPQIREAHFDVVAPIFSLAAIRLDFVSRAGIPAELAYADFPCSFKLLLISSHGMFRAPRSRSIRLAGLVGRSVGFAPFRGELPAHGGWSQALGRDNSRRFGLDDSQAPELDESQGLDDSRKFRGSTEFAS